MTKNQISMTRDFRLKNDVAGTTNLFGQFRAWLAIGTWLLVFGAFPVRAEWKTETFNLVPGWNAVYLHVDASHEDLDVLLTHTPISRVEMWAPSVTTAQFVTSIQDTNDFGSSWLSWDNDPDDGVASAFHRLIGNTACLVYVKDEYTDTNSTPVTVSSTAGFAWSLKGKAVPPAYRWTASGQNFIGFPTRTDAPPKFENYFALAPVLDSSATEVYEYVGGELGTSNPLLVDAPITTDVTRGKAYWVRDADYNRFFAPFSVTLQDSSGVHFGTKLSEYRIRIANEANTPQTVSLELVASDDPADGSTLAGAPPVLVRGELSDTDFTYAFADLATNTFAWDLAADGEIGSSVEVVLGVDRAAMTGTPGTSYGGILRFTDNSGSTGGYAEVDVPLTAEVGSLSGLWVGEAKITQVQQDIIEYEVDSKTGEYVQDDNGSYVVASSEASFGGVARSFSLRLIMHVDEAGDARLLQRVYYGLDANASPMLATKQGLLNADHLNLARRITAIHLPWTETNTVWGFDSKFGLTSIMNATVGVGYADTPSNPFLHIYHPDHDNKDAEFGTTPLARGYESYGIERNITLNAGTALVTSDSSITTTSTSSDSTSTATTTTPALPAAIQMLDLPGGSFVMGDTNHSAPPTTAPVPERIVNMSAFKMSEAEITVEQYVEFLNAAMADGRITVANTVDGTYVFGAAGQPYEGHKFIELSGTRILKDHDGDGDIDPENPLNQCWIEFDGTSTFSVKDPGAIDWVNYAYATDVGIFPAEWAGGALLANTVPTVALHGAIAANAPGTYSLTNQSPTHVVAADGIAYVANSVGDNITILDVSDPANITVLKVLQDGVDGDELNGVNHLTLSGTRLVALANANGARRVSIYDVLSPKAPVRETVLATGNTINDAEGTAHTFTHGIYYCSAIDGDNLYIAGTSDRVTILNIADPKNPVWVYEIVHTDVQADGQTIRVENVRSMQIVDNVAYFGSDQANRILIVDVTDPTSPKLLSELIDGSGGYDADVPLSLTVADGVLYFLDQSANRVTLVDVGYDTGSANIPDRMLELSASSFSETLEAPDQLAVANGRLYVASATAGALTVIDVSDPTEPSLLQTFTSSDDAYPELAGANSVAIDGTKILVTAETTGGLSVFESIPLPDPVRMVVSGDVAYVANYSGSKITVLDISDPAAVSLLGVLENGVDSERLSAVNSLTLAGDLLIATAWFSDTITIYDVTDRANPVRLKQIIDNSNLNLHRPITTTVSGSYLYISNVGAGDSDAITIYNIADPSAPEFVTEIISGQADIADSGRTVRVSNVSSMQVVDDVLYATTGDSWITVMNVKDPANPTWLAELSDGDGGFNRVSGPGSVIVKDGFLYFRSGSENAVTIAGVTVTYDDAGVPTAIAFEKLAELSHGDGTYTALEAPGQMALKDGLLYVPAATSGAVTVIDVSSPASPVRLEELVNGAGGYINLAGAGAVAVANNAVYITAADAAALTVVAPVLIGETIANWPELTDNLPSQSEVANWPATFIKYYGAKGFAEYYGADLPTEAQWEYAARGGQGYGYGTSDGTIDATKANYNEYDAHPDSGHVVPVKSYLPNPYGLYDLSGNVWEWCRDWFNPDFYATSPSPDFDPYQKSLLGSSEPIEGPSFVGGPGTAYNGDTRVRRGGSWNYHTDAQAAANREQDFTWRGNDHFGFRIVQDGSYTIAPVTATSFTALTSTSTKLTGTYQEKVTLRGKDAAKTVNGVSTTVTESKEYNIAGEFSLIRVSDIDALKTE